MERKLPENIALCSVVKAELFYGSMKSRYPEQNLQKQRQFLEHFVSYSFDDKAAKQYGIIRAQLEKVGTPIGPNDLMIASITLAQDAILITHNVKEFARIQGLFWEDWEIY